MRAILTMILVYCLAITSVFGQASNPSDTLKIGKASSANDKGLIFDTNDGVSNKKLTVEKVSKTLKYDGNIFKLGDGSGTSVKDFIFNGDNKKITYNGTTNELEYDGDLVSVGDGTNTDKTLKFNKGASSPSIKYNSTSGKIQFSNDNALFKDIGSGGGSSSSGVNLISNDSFEDGISSPWTSSGGTFSQQTYAIGSDSDLKYARFVATTSGEYVEQIVSIPTSFSVGCQADFKKVNIATSSLFKVQALDASNNVLAEKTIAASSWLKVPTISFPCPASGANNLKLRLTSLAAGTIDFDRAYIGSNQNVVTVGSVVIGEIVASSASCPSGTLEANGSAISRADYPALFNKIGITHGSGNGTTTFNIPDYRGRFLRGVDGTAGNDPDKATRTAMATGGNTGNSVGSIQSDQITSHTHNYTNNATVSLAQNGAGPQTSYVANLNAGVTTAQGGNETRPKNANVNYCIRYQGNSEENAISNEQSSWFIDANIGGQNTGLSSSSVSSYTEATAPGLDMVINGQKGSAGAEIACASGTASSGLTCSAANESIGISFTPPMSGLYEACFSFSHDANAATSSSVKTTFQVIETSNISSSVLNEGGQRTPSGMTAGSGGLTYGLIPNKVCGTFNFSDTSKKTLRLMYEQLVTGTISGSIIVADRDGLSGQRDINIIVRPLLSPYSRPILTGDQVTTPGAVKPENSIVGYYGATAGTNCSASSTCTIKQPGSFFTSVTQGSAGVMTLTTTKTYPNLQCTGNFMIGSSIDAVVQNTPLLNCTNCNSLIFTTLRRDTGVATAGMGNLNCWGY